MSLSRLVYGKRCALYDDTIGVKTSTGGNAGSSMGKGSDRVDYSARLVFLDYSSFSVDKKDLVN